MVGAALLCTAAILTACAPGGDRSGLQGVGEFTLQVNDGPAVPVFYVAGDEATSAATVLIVMHGVERNAAEYRDVWRDLVRDRDIVVVAPEFDDDDFPGSAAYNLGGVGEKDAAFGYIEPLFEETRHRIGGSQTSFEMFGHSAGAQFVHRFVMFEPDAPVALAVAANAGWYTMPDDSADYPYGLDGDAPAFDAPSAFSRRLVVLLGGDDTGDENLRQTDDADAQGRTRLDRGQEFFRRAERQAERMNIDLRWQLEEVAGVGHEKDRMAAAAAEYL